MEYVHQENASVQKDSLEKTVQKENVKINAQEMENVTKKLVFACATKALKEQIVHLVFVPTDAIQTENV